jgi:hypothetical protein
MTPVSADSDGDPRLGDLRVAYNAALDRGDTAEAARLFALLSSAIDGRFAADFTGGLRLLGRRVTQGAAPLLELWVQAKEKLTEDVRFTVTSTMHGREALSFLPADPTPQSVALAPRVPSSMWVPGFVYELDVVIQHRPGREHWTGAWLGSRDAGRRLDGEPTTDLGELR